MGRQHSAVGKKGNDFAVKGGQNGGVPQRMWHLGWPTACWFQNAAIVVVFLLFFLLQRLGLTWAEEVAFGDEPHQTVISLLAGKSTENSQHEVFARDLHHCELHTYTRYWQSWPKSCFPSRTVTPLAFPLQFKECSFCARTSSCLAALKENGAWLEWLLCISVLGACI